MRGVAARAALVVAVAGVVGAGSSPATQARDLTVTVTVGVSASSAAQLGSLGVGVDAVLGLVEEDLRGELGDAVRIDVERVTASFGARTSAAAREAARKAGVLRAAARVEALRTTLLRRGQVESPQLAAAEKALASALARADRAFAARTNPAGLACAQLGIELNGHQAFGGRAHARERWSTVYTGALPLVFPPVRDLKRGAVAALDFSAREFAAFRKGYGGARRAALTARATANAIEHQLGRLLGLAPTRGPLRDPMKGALDLAAAEHFARGITPLRFGPGARAVLRQAALEEARRCG
jgi:hypothetical protein